MLIRDEKNNSFLEVKVDHGFFQMNAQVRLASLFDIYAFAAVGVLLKILLWKRISRLYYEWKGSRIRYK